MLSRYEDAIKEKKNLELQLMEYGVYPGGVHGQLKKQINKLGSNVKNLSDQDKEDLLKELNNIMAKYF